MPNTCHSNGKGTLLREHNSMVFGFPPFNLKEAIFFLHLDLYLFYSLLPSTISGVPFILRRGTLDIQSTPLFTDKAVQPSPQGLKGAQL